MSGHNAYVSICSLTLQPRNDKNNVLQEFKERITFDWNYIGEAYKISVKEEM